MPTVARQCGCGCLRCRLGRTIDEYYGEYGFCDPIGEGPRIDVAEVLSTLGTIAGTLIAGLPEHRQRHLARSIARDALDRALLAALGRTPGTPPAEPAAVH